MLFVKQHLILYKLIVCFVCLYEKDTFPGKSPDEVAVVYQELREPANEMRTQQNVQLIKAYTELATRMAIIYI